MPSHVYPATNDRQVENPKSTKRTRDPRRKTRGEKGETRSNAFTSFDSRTRPSFVARAQLGEASKSTVPARFLFSSPARRVICTRVITRIIPRRARARAREHIDFHIGRALFLLSWFLLYSRTRFLFARNSPRNVAAKRRSYANRLTVHPRAVLPSSSRRGVRPRYWLINIHRGPSHAYAHTWLGRHCVHCVSLFSLLSTAHR